MKKPLITLILFAAVALLTLQSLRSSTEVKLSSLDSLQSDREKHIKFVLESIKGKENLPADSVFKNIQSMKGVPAGRLLRIMDVAYAQSLGVSCGHCHNTNKWESDEKKTKQITREMGKMVRRINTELLPGIEALKNPAINCTTCHRGKTKPALSLN